MSQSMFNLRVLCRDHPQRTIALVTSDHALVFQYSSPASAGISTPRCQVEFSDLSSVDLEGYRSLGDGHGTLGLITLNEDVFVCVVTGSSNAATVRPGESVSRIDYVDFYCLNRSEYEYAFEYETDSQFAADDLGRSISDSKEVVTDHPFLAFKKLLGDGSFYYSLDFNLTDRLQDRSDKAAAFDIETLDEDMLWNSYMISPLLLFRSHLPPLDRAKLDASHMLTCVIRGFASTLTIPASIPILPQVRTKFPSLLTIISRQSSRRAGTRFNARGIDDDGNVANFVETESILWIAPGITFSYVQVRGSVPIFWEQPSGFIPGQQKIEVTRSSEATQHAFNQHFEALELEYGAVHVVNLLSELKPGEAELSAKYRQHISKSSLRRKEESSQTAHHSLLRMTEYDFLAQTRGPAGYGASNQIKYELADSLDGFAYFLSEDRARSSADDREQVEGSSPVILQQEGVFRTNCLDCLDRTNLVQTIISLMAFESFLSHQGARLSSELQVRHSTLWADNGDALSRIYAGTGALKSSFTRHGKMSLAGALADARKSATRLYVNNFTDKARQQTIDLLLGRLANQVTVHLYDPMNELVSEELNRRASEYTSTKQIRLWVGTFNVNGRDEGPNTDLSPWLFPEADQSNEDPTIFAVAFQEIVELSPQQIMSTDPSTRKVWEKAVQDCLNKRSKTKGTHKYVLLRSGQLVGAALMIYVKKDALKDIKNVEGSVKKTGLSGIGGNKGGCAIRFDYENTSICLITAHLAAGFANYDDRNRDYETIDRGLRFQMNRSIADHESVIWFGDFNYRIGLGNQNVRDLVAQGDYRKPYDNDQLNLQMVAGRAFQFYSEGAITFPPTYKYDVGKDQYDTSEKARIPAWCDRVLWRGANLRQKHYQSADLRVSDHRPVWATFECTIEVVDSGLKDKLRRSLYAEKQRDVRSITDSMILVDLDEDGAPQGSIAPGLPPASSDRSRWWLDNGAPVQAKLSAPREGLMANPQRKSNPFAPNTEPDWVALPSSAEDQRTLDSKPQRKSVLPPRPGSMNAPPPPPRMMPRTSSDSSGSRTSSGVANKSPPAVPRKPLALSSQATAQRSARPERTPSADPTDLLDGAGEDQIGWKPLLPQR